MSDYSLQLALFLKSEHTRVLYCADKNHTAMESKCKSNKIDFLSIPLSHTKATNFIVAFFQLIVLLAKQKQIKNIVVFEGREHTLMGLCRLFFPFLFKNVSLIRVRGQAQVVKKRFFSFLLYRYLTNQIIFTAQAVKNCFPYQLAENKWQICPYGKTVEFPKQTLHYYHFIKENLDLHFTKDIVTFFMLGRFDPIKGHDLLLEAFSHAKLTCKAQLICVGTRQSVSAHDLYEKYKHTSIFTNHFKCDKIYQLSTEDDHKKIILYEDHFNDALLFMKNSNFGVISSLGSETICRVGVEFLQAGVPVIHSSAGALGEVLSDFRELQFQNGNLNELIQKFEIACALFEKKEQYFSEKIKAHDAWEKHYQGDVYRKIFQQENQS